jgi:Lrp/AsnC family transcriptional regulator, leucine-responsive regulatory protein
MQQCCALNALKRNAMQLDEFDRKILTLLQENNKLSQRQISEAVNISASAVNRRIATMEEAGVIRANVALVDAAKLGRPITLIVEVSVESEVLNLIDQVKSRFTSCPQVQQVYYVTGETDFVLVVSVADMTEYEQLTRQLFFAEGNIKRFRTIVVMERAKVSMAVPIVG